MRISVKKILYRILKTVVLVELAWLGVGNLLLNTELGPKIVSLKPEKFTMDWDSGWTPYPAKVSVKNVTMDIRTWSTDSKVFAGTASATINLFTLLTKRITINNLITDGLTIEVLREKPDGDRPPPRKPYPGFIIDIRNATVHSVDSFRFNEFSVTGGQVDVTGSVSMQIRGDKVIENVMANWEDAEVQIKDHRFSDTVNVAFRGGMSAFNPRVHKGREMLEKLSAQVVIDGNIGTLTPIKYLFPDVVWISEIDGHGHVRLDSFISEGKLQQGSIIDIEADALDLYFLGFHATGSGKIDARVDGAGNSRVGQTELMFDDFEIRRSSTKKPLIIGKGLNLSARAPNLGTTRHVSDLEVELQVPESHFPDISVIDNFLPQSTGVRIDHGSATISGNLKAVGPKQIANGEMHLIGENISGAFQSTEFEMDFSVDSKLSGERLEDLTIDLSGTEVSLHNGVFHNEQVEVEDNWWMNVSLEKGEIILEEPVKIEAAINMEMKDTRAILALISNMNEWISRFDGFLTVNGLTGSANVESSAKNIRIRDLNVQGDRLDLKAELDATETARDGIIWGKLGIASLGLETIAGETRWKLVNSRKWFDESKASNWSDE